jgi:hypothetical protein
MKAFILRAEVEFEAEDIDDALQRLTHHFLAVSLSGDSNLFTEGELTVQPVDGDAEFLDESPAVLSLARIGARRSLARIGARR